MNQEIQTHSSLVLGYRKRSRVIRSSPDQHQYHGQMCTLGLWHRWIDCTRFKCVFSGCKRHVELELMRLGISQEKNGWTEQDVEVAMGMLGEGTGMTLHHSGTPLAVK